MNNCRPVTFSRRTLHHGVSKYTLSVSFSSKCSLFHNSNIFGSCFIHILYTECAKIKQNNSGAKRLIHMYRRSPTFVRRIRTFLTQLGNKYFELLHSGAPKLSPELYFVPESPIPVVSHLLRFRVRIPSWEWISVVLCVVLHEIRKRKANWIGHILRRNCLLQRVIEEKVKGIEVTGSRGRKRRKLLDDLKERIRTFEGGSSRSHYVESSIWKRLWTCRKTYY